METRPRRVVIKVGTGVLTQRDNPRLDEGQIQRLTDSLASLMARGDEVVLVSSGAVGAGLSALSLSVYPEETTTRQASAAVGQIQLLNRYERLLRFHQIDVAQILVTHQDLETRERRKRILATLEALLSTRKILPIVNENDTVAVEELKFGDNDQLAALLSGIVNADIFVVLTGEDGLLPASSTFGVSAPSGSPHPDLIHEVPNIDEALNLVAPTQGRFSMGGMASKLEAIRTANLQGIPAVIASGYRTEQLSELVDGKGIGTRFPAPH